MVQLREEQLGTITLLDKANGGTVDASNARITNVANPTSPTDAVTLDFLGDILDGYGDGSVASIFGRSGVVTAGFGDYDTDLIDNASTAPGATLTDVLEYFDGYISNLANGLKYTVGPANVGAEFTSIQDAVDQAAADGADETQPAVIFIYPGTYAENVTISNQGMMLVSYEGNAGVLVSGTITLNTTTAGSFYGLKSINANALVCDASNTGLVYLESCEITSLTGTSTSNSINIRNCRFGTIDISAQSFEFNSGEVTGSVLNEIAYTTISRIRNVQFLAAVSLTRTNTASILVSIFANCTIQSELTVIPLTITSGNANHSIFIHKNTFFKASGTSAVANFVGQQTIRMHGNSYVGNMTAYTTSGSPTIIEGDFVEEINTGDIVNASTLTGSTLTNVLNNMNLATVLSVGNSTGGSDVSIADGDEIVFAGSDNLGIELLGDGTDFRIRYNDLGTTIGGSLSFLAQNGDTNGGDISLTSGSGTIDGYIRLNVASNLNVLVIGEETHNTKQDGYVLAWNAAGYNEYIPNGGSSTPNLSAVLTVGNNTGANDINFTNNAGINVALNNDLEIALDNGSFVVSDVSDLIEVSAEGLKINYSNAGLLIREWAIMPANPIATAFYAGGIAPNETNYSLFITDNGTVTEMNASLFCTMRIDGVNRLSASDENVAVNAVPIRISNNAAIPTALAGFGFIAVVAGALVYVSPNNTITTIAPA